MSVISDKINHMEWGFPFPGGLDAQDIQALEELIQLTCKSNIQIADVGCWTGKSTITLALAINQYGGHISAIDWFKGSDGTDLQRAAKDTSIKEILKAHLRYFNVESRVEIIEKSSLEAVKTFQDNSLDLVFLDADHRYLKVIDDLNAWWPKVKPGGIFCGHDCEMILHAPSAHTLEDNPDAPNPWNFFADRPDNGWNDVDCLQFHPGVVRAVSKIFPQAQIKGKQVWWVKK